MSLVGEAFRENRRVFEVPPTLKEFTHLVHIIMEEIVPFGLWPVCLSMDELTDGALSHVSSL